MRFETHSVLDFTIVQMRM